MHHNQKQFGEEQAYFSLYHERKSAKGIEGLSSTVSEGEAIEKSHLVDCLLWLCVFFLHKHRERDPPIFISIMNQGSATKGYLKASLMK